MAASLERTSGPPLRVGAVGDLLLTQVEHGRPEIGPRLSERFDACDIVVANLECTLPSDGPAVSTEPRVVADEARVLGALEWGINVVCLANNHTFDHLAAGFQRMREVLEGAGVKWFGAGLDEEQAGAPAIVETGGATVAFLGAVDPATGPVAVAGPDTFGIAGFDLESLTERIVKLKSAVDHVIVSLHWGDERFSIPSPAQLRQGRALAEAGASLVLGHHPHVLQGMEVHGGVPIAYSLGNFVADEVLFSADDRLTWNRTERTGCLLVAELGPDGIRTEQVPTVWSDGRVEVDDSGFGARHIDRLNQRLARGVTVGRFRCEHLLVKTVRPTLSHLRWSELKRLRFRHVRRALAGLLRAVRAR